MTPSSAACTDIPVFVQSRGESLGGVVSVPLGDASPYGVLLMAGHLRDRAHRNGMWVRAARRLASQGLFAFRLDYPGVGNSAGAQRVFDLEDLPTWAVHDACRFLLRETPVRRILLAGSSFGARLMLGAAPDIAEAEAVAMIAAPVFVRADSLKRKVKLRAGRILRLVPSIPNFALSEEEARRKKRLISDRRVSPSFSEPLRRFVERGSVYFLSGERDFVDELQFALQRLNVPPERIELETVPGGLHAFRTLAAQEHTIERLVGWCNRRRNGSPAIAGVASNTTEI